MSPSTLHCTQVHALSWRRPTHETTALPALLRQSRLVAAERAVARNACVAGSRRLPQRLQGGQDRLQHMRPVRPVRAALESARHDVTMHWWQLISQGQSTRMQTQHTFATWQYTTYGGRSGPSALSSAVLPSMNVPSPKMTWSL